MTKTDIEKTAVSELEKLFAKTKFIDSHFKSEDKEPCWDGFLTIHDNPNKAKGKSIKRINVQIKGKHSNDLSNGEISYPVSRSDLNSFFSDDGCLFFVVLVDDNYNTIIYYSSLLPMKIKKILNTSKGKENVSIHLSKFPNDIDYIDATVRNHYRNKELQPSSMCDKALKIQNIDILPNISEVYSTIVIPKESDPFEYLVRYDTTKYALIDNFDISIPIEEGETKKIIEINQDVNISNNGILYYEKIKRVYTEHEMTIYIGGCLSLKVEYDNKTKIHYHIDYPKDLYKIIADLPFISSVYKNNGFDCNGVKLDLQMSYETLNSFNFSIAENNILIANRINNLFEILNISKDINLDSLTKRDWELIWYLYNGLVLNKKFIINKNNYNSLNLVNLSVMKIIVANIPIDDRLYEIKNVFNTDIPVYCNDDDNKRIVTQFSVFKAEDFYDIENINYDFILKSVKENTYDEFTEYIANSILLKLISAYDKTLNKDIAKISIKLANWLSNRNKKSIVYKLNKYQLRKRLSLLDKKDVKNIKKILKAYSDHDIRFGCYVLLDNYEEAKNVYTKFSSKLKKEYKGYPIFTLYKILKK